MTLLRMCLCALVILSAPAMAADLREARVALMRDAIDMLCPLPELNGLAAQVMVPGSWFIDESRRPDVGDPRLVRVRLSVFGQDELRLERRQVAGQLRQFRVSYFANGASGPEAHLLALADGACRVQSARELRAEGEVWRFLDQLEGDMQTLRWTETLQAPWPDGQDRGGVRIGLVDSGLAYDLPLFRTRLARDAQGVPLGYDFWDLDPWPYDGDVARGPFLPIRHGTAVASVLVREAPAADLVPYRYPRPDMTRLGDLVAHAAERGVRVLAMPLGSRRQEDWSAFVAALEAHDLLAIVSAGNDGLDIDVSPIYPAALPSDHILTVTSADAFGRLAQGSNWGGEHVDIMLPAENLPVTDFRGARGTASGSSYAVPRLAAMAARLLENDPDLSTDVLRSRLLARATASPFARDGLVAAGWIANPLQE